MTSQIRTLEQQLQRPLFERLPRGVTATPVADELAAQVAGPLDELAVVTERGMPGSASSEPVHLAGPAELVCVRVLPALAPLVDQGLRLRVSIGLADDLLDGLRAGHFDLVLSAVRPRGRSVVALPLMDEEFVLVAAPTWAERIGPIEDPNALRGVPLVTYAEDLPIARRYWRHVFHTRLTGPPAVVVPDLRGVRRRRRRRRNHGSSALSLRRRTRQRRLGAAPGPGSPADQHRVPRPACGCPRTPPRDPRTRASSASSRFLVTGP